MTQWLVRVTGQVDGEYTVEAEDEWDARSIAEQEFVEEYACVCSGIDVGFDAVDAYDVEEV